MICDKPTVTHAVLVECDPADMLVDGQAIIGVGFEMPDGSIELQVRALPVNGARMVVRKLPPVMPKAFGEAAREYRQAQRKMERR